MVEYVAISVISLTYLATQFEQQSQPASAVKLVDTM